MRTTSILVRERGWVWLAKGNGWGFREACKQWLLGDDLG